MWADVLTKPKQGHTFSKSRQPNTQKNDNHNITSVQECVGVHTKSTSDKNRPWPFIHLGGALWDPNKYVRMLMKGMTRQSACTNSFVTWKVAIIYLSSQITKLNSGVSNYKAEKATTWYSRCEGITYHCKLLSHQQLLLLLKDNSARDSWQNSQKHFWIDIKSDISINKEVTSPLSICQLLLEILIIVVDIIIRIISIYPNPLSLHIRLMTL